MKVVASTNRSIGSMALCGVLLAPLFGTIGTANAIGFSWFSSSSTTIEKATDEGRLPQGAVVEGDEGFHRLLSSVYRRVLQPVSRLSQAKGKEKKVDDASADVCDWNRLGLDADACERCVDDT